MTETGNDMVAAMSLRVSGADRNLEFRRSRVG